MSDSIAQTTLTAAIAAGFDRLSPRDTMLCALYGSASAGLTGSGAPTAAANKGTTYYDTVGEVFYVNSDGTATGWTLLVTV